MESLVVSKNNFMSKLKMIQISGKNIIYRFDSEASGSGVLHSISNETLAIILEDYQTNPDDAAWRRKERMDEDFKSMVNRNYGIEEKREKLIDELSDRMDAYVMKKDLIKRIKDLREQGIHFAFHTSGNGLTTKDLVDYVILSPSITWDQLEEKVHHAETNRAPFWHLKTLGLAKEI